MGNDKNPDEVLKIQNEILKIQKKLLEMSKERTAMSKDRSRMSADRSKMSDDRSKMSLKRSEMSAQRSYMNNERTLSVWVRTSLSAMIFGIAIDRYGLMITGSSKHPDTLFGHMSTSTSLIGAGLILLSVLMALTAVWRFLIFIKRYKKEFSPPYNYTGRLPAVYAFMVVLFGTGMFVFMWFIG